jgi:cytidyltransferase-like protein
VSRKVLVSGCFDLLHSGHVRFFQEAAAFGELHVALGSDRTITGLKGRAPVTSQEERRFMVAALRCVHSASISRGQGMLDFEPEMRALKPDFLVVNMDGDTPDKRDLADSLGAEYVVLQRTPAPGLSARSTTELREMDGLPYRIDLCGGWLDQPFVSRHAPGSVLTISLEPTLRFNTRSGMASSTRRTARQLWGSHLPQGDPEHLARTLFACDNPPGTKEISGSQDAIGLVFPGLAIAHYDGGYWPDRIEQDLDEETLRFIEKSLQLVPLDPREGGYDVLARTHIDHQGAARLAGASERCANAIRQRDRSEFGKAVREGFEAQTAMFPSMLTPEISSQIGRFAGHSAGWKISGAGGGGYLILVGAEPIPDSVRVTIRRPDR